MSQYKRLHIFCDLWTRVISKQDLSVGTILIFFSFFASPLLVRFHFIFLRQCVYSYPLLSSLLHVFHFVQWHLFLLETTRTFYRLSGEETRVRMKRVFLLFFSVFRCDFLKNPHFSRCCFVRRLFTSVIFFKAFFFQFRVFYYYFIFRVAKNRKRNNVIFLPFSLCVK